MGNYKLVELRSVLERLQPGLVAVSGGLDSRLLAHLAWKWGFDYQGVHLTGPHIALHESGAAVAWLAATGKPFHTLTTNPLRYASVLRNSVNRCYTCKKVMFLRVKELARDLRRPNILEGTHSSDTNRYRPGLKALKELSIKSPLAQVGLTKPELREIAREQGLDNPDQPSRPCLLTRFDYDLILTQEQLERTAAAELGLQQLGLKEYRLRIHHEDRFVLQLHPEERSRWEEIQTDGKSVLQSHGFEGTRVIFNENMSGYFDVFEH